MSNTVRSLKVNNTPLQIAGEDQVIREFTLGGPHCGRDVRMLLDRKVLEHLLDVAKSSNCNRVVLHGAGIKMKVRRAASGHMYETLHLVSNMPVPEMLPSEMQMNTSRMAQEGMKDMYQLIK
tara:strand:- start:195 stop:560 length:366 start_codon:yes stop_codon:yes gene_type:complete